MKIGDCIKNLLWEIIYSVTMTVYLIRLNALNKELLSGNFINVFELLQYKDYAPLTFFGVALFLFLIGCFLIWLRIRRYRWGMDTFEDLVMSFLAIVTIFILLILLIVFINNPILRAVFAAGLVVLGVLGFGK